MKRIIDGVTYNTDTSTILARSQYEALYANEPFPCVGILYQTRGGAYFIHEKIDLGLVNEDEATRIEKDRCAALTEKEAQAFIMEGDVEVFHNPFEDPPEAEAESEASTTLYVRVPVSLKKRLEQSAKAEKLSGNSWAIRCIEKCLSPDEKVRDDIGFAWYLASKIALDNDNLLTRRSISMIAEEIRDIIEHNWRSLGFAEGAFDKDIADLAVNYLNRANIYIEELDE